MQFIHCRGGIMMLNAPYLDAHSFCPQPETHGNRQETPYCSLIRFAVLSSMAFVLARHIRMAIPGSLSSLLNLFVSKHMVVLSNIASLFPHLCQFLPIVSTNSPHTFS